MMREIKMFFVDLYEAYEEACENADLMNKTV